MPWLFLYPSKTMFLVHCSKYYELLYIEINHSPLLTRRLLNYNFIHGPSQAVIACRPNNIIFKKRVWSRPPTSASVGIMWNLLLHVGGRGRILSTYHRPNVALLARLQMVTKYFRNLVMVHFFRTRFTRFSENIRRSDDHMASWRYKEER